MTRSLSDNLLKSSWIVSKPDEEKRLIDSNELALKKIEEERRRLENLRANLKPTSPDAFSEGLQVEQVDALFGEENDSGLTDGNVIESVAIQDGMEPVITDQTAPEYLAPPQPVYDGPSPEELIEGAKQEIQSMKATAEAELRKKEKEVMHQAETAGYVEGKKRAESEYQVKMQALQSTEQELIANYEQKLKEMEVELVAELSDIYSHVLGASMKDYGPTILHVLDTAIHESDDVKSFMIHVSKEEVGFVKNNIDSLRIGLSAQTELEIIEDVTISEGDAYIETDGEIFDCSIDTQLSNLAKQIKALAYQKD